jgi:hypothetical protein
MSSRLRWSSSLALTLSLGAVAPLPAQAAPASKAQCIAAAEATQDLRDKKRLLAAKEQVVICANDACPKVVRTECIAWLRDIEAATPSLVFAARDEKNRDLVETKILLDGKIVAEKLDGSSVTLDPGEHTVRWEPRDPELSPVEQKVVVALGEKNRVLTASLKRPATAASATSGTPSAEPPPTAPLTLPAEPPARSTWPWIAGGVGVAGLATFGVFQGLARAGKSDLESGCGRTHSCPDGDVAPVRTKFLISGIGLGVGVVGLATAGALFVFRGPASTKTTASAAPLPGGGSLSLAGTF